MCQVLNWRKTSPRLADGSLARAGWGVEQPIVSFGMLSGVDRTLPAGNFPPVLQCNLTTVESSSGAGVVNQEGKLVGIIVAGGRTVAPTRLGVCRSREACSAINPCSWGKAKKQ